MRKTVIALIGICGVVLIAGAGTYFYTMSVGKEQLKQLAQEGGFCKQADCADGIEYAGGFLSNEFGLSPRGVQWCMGVDELARRDFIFGEAARNLYTETLYIPCNADGDTDASTGLPVDED